MNSILLSAFNASAWTGPTGNNTYLLDGAIPTLIDAGVGHPDHLAAIGDALGGRVLAQVLITHGHADHVEGLPALAARWPGLRVRALGPIGADAAEPLRDNEIVKTGDEEVRVLATPGHAPNHCCFVAGDEVYCGDLVRAGGTVVIAASRGGDLAAYLESLVRVRALAPRRLLPGHGPAIDDPTAVIGAYIQHRAERDAQVLSLLRSGMTTAAGIAAAIYQGLDVSLMPAARDTVTAHLVKLEREGKAVRDSEMWRLSQPPTSNFPR